MLKNNKQDKRIMIIKVLKSMLQIDISVLQYCYQNEDEVEKREHLKKEIALNESAKKQLTQIRHTEILEDIYGYLIGGKEAYFNIVAPTIMSEKVAEWDTDKGFQEFLDLQAKAIKEREEQIAKAKVEKVD